METKRLLSQYKQKLNYEQVFIILQHCYSKCQVNISSRCAVPRSTFDAKVKQYDAEKQRMMREDRVEEARRQQDAICVVSSVIDGVIIMMMVA